MDSPDLRTERRLAGSLLVLGMALFIAGLCALFFGANFMAFLEAPPDAPLEPLLAGLSNNIVAWQWGWVLLIAAVVTTALGLAMLTILLWKAGDRTFSWLGLIAFLLGVVLWVISVTFSLSVTVWAAQEAARGTAIPDFYVPSDRWAFMLFNVYTVLAFSGLAAYGAAILRTRLLPRWVGWATITWSIVEFGVFLLTFDVPPALHHVMPLIIGIVLLLRRDRVPVGVDRQKLSARVSTVQ